MSTCVESGWTAPEQDRRDAGPRMDRIVIGLLLSAVGVAWLLDLTGVSVPWRMFPAGAAILIGVGLLATLLGGAGGRGVLIALGMVATLLGVAVGVGVDRDDGPAGDRLLAPTSAEWPVQERISAGTGRGQSWIGLKAVPRPRDSALPLCWLESHCCCKSWGCWSCAGRWSFR